MAGLTNDEAHVTHVEKIEEETVIIWRFNGMVTDNTTVEKARGVTIRGSQLSGALARPKRIPCYLEWSRILRNLYIHGS